VELGYGLIRGAETLEKDAKEDRIRDIASY
jgi:hypothetical protein